MTKAAVNTIIVKLNVSSGIFNNFTDGFDDIFPSILSQGIR